MKEDSLLKKAESEFLKKICMLYIFLPTPYIFILRSVGDTLSSNLVFLLILNAIFCASIRKYYNISAFLLATFPSITLLYYGPRFGEYIGSQMFCFGFISVCIILFSTRPRLLILSSVTPILCQLFLEVTDYSFFFQRFNLTENDISFIYNCVSISTFINIIAAFYFFIKFKKKTERILKNNSKSIFEKFNLTKREFEIIDCLIEGQTNKEMSESLFIGITTIKTHLSSIYKKLNVSNRTQVVSLLSKNI